jgi:hypothetical protein
MIDYRIGTTAAVRHQLEEMVRLVETAADVEYAAPCQDDSGSTVAEVAAHCAEGYEMTAMWLQRLTSGVAVAAAPAAPAAAHEHPHAHPHSHPHEAGPGDAEQGQAAMAGRLRVGGQAVVAQIGTLTAEQLSIVPPASPFADGTSPLETAIRGLAGHLQEHMEHMSAAISAMRRA